MYERITDLIGRAALAIAAGFLSAMMILTVVDVCLRYVFSSPLPSTGELTQFFLAITIFAGLVLISRDGGHIIVSLLETQLERTAPWFYKGLYAVSNTLGAALICYILFLLALDAWEFEEISIVTEFPMVWLIGFLAVLSLLCLVVSFRVFLRGNRGHDSGAMTQRIER